MRFFFLNCDCAHLFGISNAIATRVQKTFLFPPSPVVESRPDGTNALDCHIKTFVAENELFISKIIRKKISNGLSDFNYVTHKSRQTQYNEKLSRANAITFIIIQNLRQRW